MTHIHKLFLIAGASAVALSGCAKKDSVQSDTTAMRVEASNDSLLRSDSMRADSIRLDSARRADSARIVDTLAGKRGTP